MAEVQDSNYSGGKREADVAILAGGLVAVGVFMVTVCVLLYCCCAKRLRRRSDEETSVTSPSPPAPKFDSQWAARGASLPASVSIHLPRSLSALSLPEVTAGHAQFGGRDVRNLRFTSFLVEPVSGWRSVSPEGPVAYEKIPFPAPPSRDVVFCGTSEDCDVTSPYPWDSPTSTSEDSVFYDTLSLPRSSFVTQASIEVSTLDSCDEDYASLQRPTSNPTTTPTNAVAPPVGRHTNSFDSSGYAVIGHLEHARFPEVYTAQSPCRSGVREDDQVDETFPSVFLQPGPIVSPSVAEREELKSPVSGVNSSPLNEGKCSTFGQMPSTKSDSQEGHVVSEETARQRELREQRMILSRCNSAPREAGVSVVPCRRRQDQGTWSCRNPSIQKDLLGQTTVRKSQSELETSNSVETAKKSSLASSHCHQGSEGSENTVRGGRPPVTHEYWCLESGDGRTALSDRQEGPCSSGDSGQDRSWPSSAGSRPDVSSKGHSEYDHLHRKGEPPRGDGASRLARSLGTSPENISGGQEDFRRQSPDFVYVEKSPCSHLPENSPKRGESSQNVATVPKSPRSRMPQRPTGREEDDLDYVIVPRSPFSRPPEAHATEKGEHPSSEKKSSPSAPKDRSPHSEWKKQTKEETTNWACLPKPSRSSATSLAKAKKGDLASEYDHLRQSHNTRVPVHCHQYARIRPQLAGQAGQGPGVTRPPGGQFPARGEAPPTQGGKRRGVTLPDTPQHRQFRSVNLSNRPQDRERWGVNVSNRPQGGHTQSVNIPIRPQGKRTQSVNIPIRPQDGHTQSVNIPNRPHDGHTQTVNVPNRPQGKRTQSVNAPSLPQQGQTQSVNIPNRPQCGHTQSVNIPNLPQGRHTQSVNIPNRPHNGHAQTVNILNRPQGKRTQSVNTPNRPQDEHTQTVNTPNRPQGGRLGGVNASDRSPATQLRGVNTPTRSPGNQTQDTAEKPRPSESTPSHVTGSPRPSEGQGQSRRKAPREEFFLKL